MSGIQHRQEQTKSGTYDVGCHYHRNTNELNNDLYFGDDGMTGLEYVLIIGVVVIIYIGALLILKRFK